MKKEIIDKIRERIISSKENYILDKEPEIVCTDDIIKFNYTDIYKGRFRANEFKYSIIFNILDQTLEMKLEKFMYLYTNEEKKIMDIKTSGEDEVILDVYFKNGKIYNKVYNDGILYMENDLILTIEKETELLNYNYKKEYYDYKYPHHIDHYHIPCAISDFLFNKYYDIYKHKKENKAIKEECKYIYFNIDFVQQAVRTFSLLLHEILLCYNEYKSELETTYDTVYLLKNLMIKYSYHYMKILGIDENDKSYDDWSLVDVSGVECRYALDVFKSDNIIYLNLYEKNDILTSVIGHLVFYEENNSLKVKTELTLDDTKILNNNYNGRELYLANEDIITINNKDDFNTLKEYIKLDYMTSKIINEYDDNLYSTRIKMYYDFLLEPIHEMLEEEIIENKTGIDLIKLLLNKDNITHRINI